MKTLAELMPGEWGMAEEHKCEKLKRLGLISGTKVYCLRKSPLGDPTAYDIRGAVFAVRKKDAERVPISEERGRA